MEKKIILVHNKEMETLDIWFDDPQEEYVCEEVGEEIILKKSKEGKVIGIEVLYFTGKDIPLEFKAIAKSKV
ncbi:hypothetical protein Asulf_00021 [Archaeoglobus sulfaticallidus PM70-1]|uniref:DUF2283 domain-containing protein n=1 Tax=Archaeoglobus sulfaticallidus PM70-1 TaxID=387631 RepID=N0BCW1_9EURY|nr:DUF2283 domain-containing protein [Archaeoglobus sulfaticallidus]AGK60057.1 hypothetical protein Asulf_00021 [Archaeoglobus sulfaticallidus PM70-1]